jgi:outer membrane lipoprotein-sorting protein
MKYHPVTILTVIVIIAVLTGCARLPVREDIPNTPDQIISSLTKQRGSFQRYTAMGTMRLQNELQSITLNCRWEIRMPDTVRIRIYGPLGFRMGDVVIQGEQVDVYNYWMDQQMTTTLDSLVTQFPGMVAVSNAEEIYPFPYLSRINLENVDLNLSQPESGIWIFRDSLELHSLCLDDKYLIVAWESLQTPTQEHALKKEYQRYRRIRGNWLPSQVRYSQGQSEQWMDVVFESITVR